MELLAQDATLYDPESTNIVHHVNQALRAHVLFHRDKDYIVRNGEVVLIDEFTGRMMSGRRLSEGLHQAIEAKEGVGIRPENVTLASVTFQNYFRLYEKLAGMTGTAATEADEFFEIYKLGVVEVPTNLPVIREDHDDQVFRTAREKHEAIVAGDPARPRGRPADPRRHYLDREVREPLEAADRGQGPAQRAERPLPRAGGADHRRGWRARRGDDRHQHGRARHRHPARRQRRHARRH